MVVDTGRTVDSGTKPTSMNAITSIIFRITQSSGGKNFDNVWIDNVCKSDGLHRTIRVLAMVLSVKSAVFIILSEALKSVTAVVQTAVNFRQNRKS
jgi:hypothetical protein